ncbi:hypothetical protein ALDI51_19330 [Alicycliphilus denitrificans]|nr:hypothetical protein ALDI51_19330 [Alicycliphilus denitrificans]
MNAFFIQKNNYKTVRMCENWRFGRESGAVIERSKRREMKLAIGMPFPLKKAVGERAEICYLRGA